MVLKTSAIRRAQSQEELVPLVNFCKAGQLPEVQAWIAAGKPVNPPELENNRSRKRSPFEYAITNGFHSLVRVLLEGGASTQPEGNFCPMSRALEDRRFDLVQLLVEYGYDPTTINMREVFATWDPEIMEYFIDRGADAETGMPLASALCDKIKTCLRIFKKYKDQFPSFQEQANVALRHHCVEGSLKWVSLMLWAGADPLAPGEAEPITCPEPEEGGLSAVGFAALYGNYEVLSLRQVKVPIDHPTAYDILRYCCDGDGLKIVERLLKQGLNPNDQDNGGASAIQEVLAKLEWVGGYNIHSWDIDAKGKDTPESRDNMKAIHLLAKHGGRWCPRDSYQMNSARRSLLKMKPDYTVELAWIMAKYRACSKSDIKILLRTPTIKRHTAKYKSRLEEIVDKWPEDGEG